MDCAVPSCVTVVQYPSAHALVIKMCARSAPALAILLCARSAPSVPFPPPGGSQALLTVGSQRLLAVGCFAPFPQWFMWSTDSWSTQTSVSGLLHHSTVLHPVQYFTPQLTLLSPVQHSRVNFAPQHILLHPVQHSTVRQGIVQYVNPCDMYIWAPHTMRAQYIRPRGGNRYC